MFYVAGYSVDDSCVDDSCVSLMFYVAGYSVDDSSIDDSCDYNSCFNVLCCRVFC